MSSARFPGKVLAPFRGRPLLASVVERVARAVPAVVVATSEDPSDDPLAAYAPKLGVDVFRGPLDDVLGRFQGAARAFPCEAFVRISADSPWMDPDVLRRVLAEFREDLDLATNVHPRTFPKGHSVEVLRTSTFLAIDAAALTPEQREHATLVYYQSPGRFRLRNVSSADPALAAKNFCVDTLEDLRRLEGGAA